MEATPYTGCVYIATNVANGSVYVGKTIHGMDRRRRAHQSACKRTNSWFHRAIRKHGIHNFVWHEAFMSDDESALFEAETNIIAFLKAEGIRIYNMSAGGEGPSGYKRSAAERAKLSASRKGIVFSAEHRANLSKGTKGRKMPTCSPDRKAKIKETWDRKIENGFTHSEDTMEKLRSKAKLRQTEQERERLREIGAKGRASRWAKPE